MSWNDHDHRGDYAEAGHDHYDYADKHHRHYDDESTIAGLREDLSGAYQRIHDLESELNEAHAAVKRLDEDVRKLWQHISSMPGGV